MKGLDYLFIALLMLGSYLFANINFAKIISKCKKRDITKEGSGNPGTLNMLRTFGFFWAILNMCLEILKGFIPSLIGYLLFGDVGLYLCGFSAVIGHIYPVVFKFKGGKGVACTCGMFLAANWWVCLIVVAVCFTFVTITSIGSVGTLGFVLIMSIIELCLLNPADWICYVVIGLNLALIFYAHRKNIVRLIKGKENPTNIKGAFKKDVQKIKDKRANNQSNFNDNINNINQENSSIKNDNENSEEKIANVSILSTNSNAENIDSINESSNN
ncbi:MAG: glycerol-3-phosphate 1-O-acyltransferase PlsY [Clostridia bacterium]|nr:glycerol-3-phosphate 1-O-acyltransferase PlsY [Clostridia bacterium]